MSAIKKYLSFDISLQGKGHRHGRQVLAGRPDNNQMSGRYFIDQGRQFSRLASYSRGVAMHLFLWILVVGALIVEYMNIIVGLRQI
jgi:hypothetical protein